MEGGEGRKEGRKKRVGEKGSGMGRGMGRGGRREERRGWERRGGGWGGGRGCGRRKEKDKIKMKGSGGKNGVKERMEGWRERDINGRLVLHKRHSHKVGMYIFTTSPICLGLPRTVPGYPMSPISQLVNPV